MKTKTSTILITSTLLLVMLLSLAVSPGKAQQGPSGPLSPDADQFTYLPLVGTNPHSTSTSATNLSQEMTEVTDANCTVNGTTRTCHLWAQATMLAMPDGRQVPVWGFADSSTGPATVPGPTLRAAPGDTLEVVLHNEVPGEQIALAFPAQADMIPDLTGVAAGGSTTYTFDVTEPGAYFYEAGLTEGGARQVTMGLFGAVVVDDPAPTWDQEVLLFFGTIDPDFNADPDGFDMHAYRPQYWLINSAAYPDTGLIGVTAGQTVLMRYLNAGVEHRSIGLLGMNHQIFRVDGEALPYPRGGVTVPIPPGQTVEALVRVPASAPAEALFPLFDTSLRHHNNNQRMADMRAAYGGVLSFLHIGAMTAGEGPAVTNTAATPQRSTGSTGVTLSATLTDADSNVVAFETFVDTLGAAGTGLRTNVPPASPANVEQVYTPAEVAAWAEGEHTLYIRGRDAFGNWGAPDSAMVVIDRTAPAVSGVAASPNPTSGAPTVTLTATGSDPVVLGMASGSVITAAEWFNGTDPGAGSGTSMSAVDGAFDSDSESLTATINVSSWTPGAHVLNVRVRDEVGQWSPAGTTSLNVIQANDAIFQDGFESGSTSLWSSTTGTGVSVTNTAAMQGAYGLQANVANGAGYVTDTTPNNEVTYHARFYFNPRSTTTGAGIQDIFVARTTGGTTVFRVQYQRTSGGVYRVRLQVQRAGGVTNTSYVNLNNNQANSIEVAWESAASASVQLYVNGTLQQTLSGLNTSAYTIGTVRLGPSAGVAGATGTPYFDAFVSTRSSYIGP